MGLLMEDMLSRNCKWLRAEDRTVWGRVMRVAWPGGGEASGVPCSGDLSMGGEPATDEPTELVSWRRPNQSVVSVRLAALLVRRSVFARSTHNHHLLPLPMPAPSGHLSLDGYVPSSPSTDAHLIDPYAAHQRRVFDAESDNAEYGRRDTYASDSSNAHFMEPSYDERNPNYDYYRKYSQHLCLSPRSLSYHAQLLKTLIQTVMFMANVMLPRPSLWVLRGLGAWATLMPQLQLSLTMGDQLAHESRTRPGLSNVRFRYQKKRLKIYSLTSLKSLASSEIR